MQGILGKKIGMTQIYSPEGALIPVTVIQAGPCVVVQQKTQEKDGYSAVQLGFGPQKPQRMTKPLVGHFAKAGAAPQRHIVEFPVDGDLPEVGSEVTVAIFEQGQKVDVSARSKGKGFQGVIKRHHFAGGPKTHGSQTWRRPGSIGMAADPSRVMKGIKMGGQTGYDNVTVQNLEVVEVRPEDHLLLIRGGIPGPNGGLVKIRGAVKAQK